MDGTPFKTTKGRSHHSEGNLDQHRVAADFRLASDCARWAVPRLCEVSREEHMEGECAGATEGQPQEDVLVPGTIDFEAQRPQVSALLFICPNLAHLYVQGLSLDFRKEGWSGFLLRRS